MVRYRRTPRVRKSSSRRRTYRRRPRSSRRRASRKRPSRKRTYRKRTYHKGAAYAGLAEAVGLGIDLTVSGAVDIIKDEIGSYYPSIGPSVMDRIIQTVVKQSYDGSGDLHFFRTKQNDGESFESPRDKICDKVHKELLPYKSHNEPLSEEAVAEIKRQAEIAAVDQELAQLAREEAEITKLEAAEKEAKRVLRIAAKKDGEAFKKRPR
jgi:hypothetical protein